MISCGDLSKLYTHARWQDGHIALPHDACVQTGRGPLRQSNRVTSNKSRCVGLFRVKPTVTIHLYTSSSPCGNSTVRRWGVCPREKAHTGYQDETNLTWPCTPHEAIELAQRDQGQIAACVKRDVCQVTVKNKVVPGRHSDGQVNLGHADTLETTQASVGGKKIAASCYAIGTAPPDSGQGRVLSCSDKIALWNALGVQGTLLSNIIRPVYLATVTVGRKFSRKHLCRALCCRLQELPACQSPLFFEHSFLEASMRVENAKPWFSLNHPALLCTGVKLNPGAIDQTTKANFSDAQCLAWSCVFEKAVIINGETGRAVENGTPVGICRRKISQSFADLWFDTTKSDKASALAQQLRSDLPLDWAAVKQQTRIGHLYRARKRLALQIMLSRVTPSFARKRKRAKRS